MEGIEEPAIETAPTISFEHDGQMLINITSAALEARFGAKTAARLWKKHGGKSNQGDN